MTDTHITVIGNLTADPELRFTASGTPVANFTIASTPRTFDRQANEWRDGEALFMRCAIWKDYAENVAESLRKGMQVMARGKLKQRSWEKDGQRRSSVELEVEDVGPTLRFSTAVVQRASRGGSTSRAPQDDPWGSAPANGGYDDTEAPF